MSAASYVLTPTARQHLREAKAWSLARWGQELTEQYFLDLEKTSPSIIPELPGARSLLAKAGSGFILRASTTLCTCH